MKRRFFIGLVIATANVLCQAQSQPTYKCVTGKKVSYSDEPCVGATVVDTTPTQGLDKITGVSKKGADVRNAEFNKAMADVYRPILRQTPEDRARASKRIHLYPEDTAECYILDRQIKDGSQAQETELYKSRKRFKDLKC